MGNKLTFAQWQASKEIPPWIYTTPHTRYGFVEISKAVNHLTEAFKPLEPKLTVVIDFLAQIKEQLRNSMEDIS